MVSLPIMLASVASLYGVVTAHREDPPLLNHSPFLMAHDAGTGYLEPGHLTEMVFNWTATQTTGFIGQLDCGARALDIRPRLAEGKRLIMHHGPISIEYPLREALSEVLMWTSNQTEELVLLVVDRPSSIPKGEDCLRAVMSLLSDLRIAQLMPSDLPGLTLDEGKIRARHPSSGGLVLALPYGSINNYDPAITCYGTSRSNVPPSVEIAPVRAWQHWSCYDPRDNAYAF
eukprot:1901280-Pyramimonas_sp.AAC.1